MGMTNFKINIGKIKIVRAKSPKYKSLSGSLGKSSKQQNLSGQLAQIQKQNNKMNKSVGFNTFQQKSLDKDIKRFQKMENKEIQKTSSSLSKPSFEEEKLKEGRDKVQEIFAKEKEKFDMGQKQYDVIPENTEKV